MDEAVSVCIILILISVVIYFAAMIYNKASSCTGTDNADIFAPVEVASSICAFVSQINLIAYIFQYEAELSVDNGLMWVGIASIFFMIPPFLHDLLFVFRLQHHPIIQRSPIAQLWFSHYSAVFAFSSILSFGTYPVLDLINSRIFGLDWFDIGLFTSDIFEVNKMEIKKTIYIKNLPQIIIQIIFTILIGRFESAAILAFVMSLKSMLDSFSVYMKQKGWNADWGRSRYVIRFGNDNEAVSEEEKRKIMKYKGLKKQLQERLAELFNIAMGSIEIGFIMQNVNGCIISVEQYIFRDDLEQIHMELKENVSMNNESNIEVSANLYTKLSFETLKKEINQVLSAHFDLDTADLEVTYYDHYSEAIDANTENKPLL